MALLILTNPSLTNYVKVSSDRGERVNRYELFTVDPNSNFALDEADVVVPFDTEIPDVLRGGALTVYEPDLDSLARQEVANFIAGGLDIHYYTSTGILNTNRIVALDVETGKIDYVSAQGDDFLGVLRSDTTDGQYMRVKTAGTVSVFLGGTVSIGDYVGSDTTGRGVAVSTTGNTAIGVATTAGAENDTISITVAKKTVA